MITYREIKKEEIKEVAKMITKSFGNYPFYLLTFEDKFKNKEKLYKYLEKLNRIYILSNFRKHKVIVGIENNKIISVLMLQDPKSKRLSIWDYIVSGGIKLVFPVGFKRIIDFFKISNKVHEEVENNYPNSLYIELLVISNELKGKGYGSKLFNEFLFPYLKKEGIKELSLITNTEINSKFYLKNGFQNFSIKNLKYKEKEITTWSFIKKL